MDEQKTDKWLQRALHHRIRHFRQRLAAEDALLALSILGICAGLLTGTVILAFRFLIEWPLTHILPGQNSENFEALGSNLHFLMPIAGALLLGLVIQVIFKQAPRVGVFHVIERLNVNHGHLPLKNAVVQFFAGSFAIISGQSAGREGPAVHLGAAASSLLGQYWRLPNNSIRVLVGCGTAAAISASFNTPIAGVIFAMEVVMMEYTIAGFTPIILASVAGAVVTRLVYGTEPAFMVPAINLHSLLELPYLILLGCIIGAASASFTWIMSQSLRLSEMAFWLRMLLAGTVTGCLAFWVPEIMGIGYDTLEQSLLGQIGFSALVFIALAKIVATAISCGLGMPIGLIGPSLLIGACIGGAAGIIGQIWMPEQASSHSLYVMLGMGAMMGAVLNAPLAALMALLELTNNPNIILPGMLTIVAATLTASQLFKQRSAHRTVLHHLGALAQHSLLFQALQRVGVTSIMNQNVAISARSINREQLLHMAKQQYRWILVMDEGNQSILLSGINLANLCAESEAEGDEPQAIPTTEVIDILGLPGKQRPVSPLHFQATLQEAWETMSTHKTDAIYMSGSIAPFTPPVCGILTRQDIENYCSIPHSSE